ncbi:MAG: gliding motility-associated C-terminal domain-containing protein [Saprospiraceae bacterium]|uniref:Gliding motility-associated C-terminal domain-containing protein n=1 Tax=Candidatus Defluviibacterium haderslevense TaxID=2981993 RepID=A0A9D7S651_9BACT|nr:gliding motility-associated C-terminal domain-containing protein [Candidatus Defluviibacterium haderslevense]
MKIRIAVIIFSLLLFTFVIYSQGTSKLWMFGENAGIDFKNVPALPISTGIIFTSESGTTVTDSIGHLLFLVSNNTVYNTNKIDMPNGSSLICNGGSSAQAPLVLQNPVNSNQYYIFQTADEMDPQFKGNLRYSLVDLCLDNGFGDIISTLKNIQIPGNYSERITAIPLKNGSEYWILCSEHFVNTIHCFKLDVNGIDITPVTSKFGDIYSAQVGFIVANHRKDQIAYSSSLDVNNGIWIMDFDTLSGKASNLNQIELFKHLYGIAFSPNDKSLYYSYFYGNSGIYQYDLVNKINTPLIDKLGNYLYGQIVEGPDKIIYIAKPNAKQIAAIINPDSPGIACNFIDNYLNLNAGSLCKLSLQNTALFFRNKTIENRPDLLGSDTVLCSPFNLKLFVNYPQVIWSDGTVKQDIIITKPGTYWVKVEECNSIKIDTIHIKEASTAATLMMTVCDSTSINGIRYIQSGIYTQILTNTNHCDSILTIQLNVLKNSNSKLEMNACDSAIINGTIYTQSGFYKQTLKNSNQCDSILNIELRLLKSNASSIAINSCDSTKINGVSYTQSGNYLQTLTNVDLCDSMLQINLKILKSSSSTLFRSGCDSIIINSIKYLQSGKYKQYVLNMNGCDSLIQIELSITKSTLNTLKAGNDTSICQGERIVLQGSYNGISNLSWESKFGYFENPNQLITTYYSNSIGDDIVYLHSKDDCNYYTDSLTIHIIPKLNIELHQDTLFAPCNEFVFSATGATKYIWTPKAFIECLDTLCQKVKIITTVPIHFTISSMDPCVEPAFLNIAGLQLNNDLFVPNVFSPNGDQINDLFLPTFKCDQVEFYKLQIFDRFGNLVFETLNKDNGWNGKFESQNMNPGVFAYHIQYQIKGSKRKLKAGDVTLVR